MASLNVVADMSGEQNQSKASRASRRKRLRKKAKNAGNTMEDMSTRCPTLSCSEPSDVEVDQRQGSRVEQMEEQIRDLELKLNRLAEGRYESAGIQSVPSVRLLSPEDAARIYLALPLRRIGQLAAEAENVTYAVHRVCSQTWATTFEETASVLNTAFVVPLGGPVRGPF